MNYAYIEVGLQEIVGEISLCIGITGCTFRCVGCHSPELHNPNNGNPLTEEKYIDTLRAYKNKCSCVCFMGGDHCEDELVSFLQIARQMGFKTALYTGAYWVGDDLRKELDYCKVGPYIAPLGGLSERTTNQRMYKITSGVMEDITKEYWR